VLDRQPAKPIAAERSDEEGFFCATIPGAERDVPYRLRILKLDGSEELMRDAYQYGPIMGDVDLHLFSEGQHWQIYEKFGAHLRTIGPPSQSYGAASDATGVYFAVWAPNAERVSVVGDFNDWDGRVNPMRKLLSAGVWELFLPGINQGAHYKFEIRTQIHGIAGVRFGTLCLERRRMDGRAAEKELAAKSDQHLRGAPRFMAPTRSHARNV
jgi:1,4-alpha-glucan branching enzyme